MKTDFPPLLRLGNWEALLSNCMPDTEAVRQHFGDHFHAFLVDPTGPGEARGYLIIASPLFFSEQGQLTWLSQSERPAWGEFYRTMEATYRQFCQARSLNPPQKIISNDFFTFSWPQPGYDSTDRLNSSPKIKFPNQFFALVIENPDEHSYINVFLYVLFLATRWHVEQGGLCLHSAAVVRGQDGFLFLGDSDAGKTTVAQLSASAGHPALGDELNFIIRDGKNSYLLAAAPSPQLSPVDYSALRPPLHRVFTLIKDDNDYLVPLPPIHLARALFNSFMQAPKTHRLPDAVVGLAFQTVCAIARQVPGYELHFRKSPDFWDVIDAELGN